MVMGDKFADLSSDTTFCGVVEGPVDPEELAADGGGPFVMAEAFLS